MSLIQKMQELLTLQNFRDFAAKIFSCRDHLANLLGSLCGSPDIPDSFGHVERRKHATNANKNRLHIWLTTPCLEQVKQRSKAQIHPKNIGACDFNSKSFHLPSIKVMPCYVPKKESSITRIFRASTLCMMFGHWTLRT